MTATPDDLAKGKAADPAVPATHPKAIWFFFWGEFAERSSYYGMRAILFLYMTKALGMATERAAPAYAGFKAACYLLPLAGGYIADRWLGRYWTIVGFSVPYVIGQFLLAEFPSELFMFIALALLAAGSGVIKPNISTMMGETYDEKRPGQARLRSSAFLWFYFAVNIGALVSQLGLPLVRQHYILNDSRITPEVRAQLESALAEGKDILPLTPGDVLKDAFSVAFAIPAWLMVGSLIIFALGKPYYAHKRPEVHHLTPDERRLQWQTLVRLFGIFALVVLFWFGYEHNDTLWIEFISNHVNLRLPFANKTIAPDQLQFLNALFVIILVPTFNLLFGRFDPQVKIFTPMRKVLAGFLLTAAAVSIMAAAGFIVRSDPSAKVSVFWPAAAYIVLTIGEVLLYATMLEIAYTAAPKSMKGFVTACFLLTNTLGNFLNMAWMPLYGKTIAPGPFFAVTAGCVLLAAFAFLFVGRQFERSQAEAEQAGLT
jgi:POT family proton-dependent oligopeptide transporter